jgi:hypothetical protein
MTDRRRALVLGWQRMAGQPCMQAASEPGLTGSRYVVLLGREPPGQRPDLFQETPDE